MSHLDTLAELQFKIVQHIAFCPMPPHTYNEIVELFQQLSEHINTNFEAKEEKTNVINKTLFAEVTKELERALNKITEYEQINLKLNTIIVALKEQIIDVKSDNERLIDDKNKLQQIIQKRIKENEELKNKNSSKNNPLNIEQTLERQEIFNKSIHNRVDALEKTIHSLSTVSNGVETIIDQIRKGKI